MIKLNLKGQRFGNLTVIEDVGNAGISKWLCKCDCGAETVVYGSNLTSGQTKSCGCLKKKHGDSRSKLYNIYCQMTRIGMCDEWKEYEVFKVWASENGYSEGVRIIRKDVSQPYSPENCEVKGKNQ